MSAITANLQTGETILFTIKRGRKWFDILGMVFLYFIMIPVIFVAAMYFLVPILMAILPEDVALISIGTFLAVFSLAMVLDFIHFLVDEIALTDRRVIGRAQGASTLAFHKIDVPLASIGSASANGSTLEIKRKDGKRALLTRNLRDSDKFAAKVTERINQQA